MYICICRKVTDNQIQQAIAQGASRMRDLHQQFELGSQCGKCCECARELLRNAQETTHTSIPCCSAA